MAPVAGTLFLVGAVFSMLRIYGFAMAGENFVNKLRSDLYKSIISQELAFFDSRRVGELVNRLSADTFLMSKAFAGENFSGSMRNIASVVASVGFMTYLSPQLTLAAVGVMPVAGAMAAVYGSKKKSERKIILLVQNLIKIC